STPLAADAPSISPRSVSTPAPGTMHTGTLRHAARTCSTTRSRSCVSAPETKTSPPAGNGTSARTAARGRAKPSRAVTEMQKLRAVIDLHDCKPPPVKPIPHACRLRGPCPRGVWGRLRPHREGDPGRLLPDGQGRPLAVLFFF